MRPLKALLFSIFVVFTAIAVSALVICGKCGFEATAASAQCSNCGAAVNGTAKPASPVDPPEGASSPSEGHSTDATSISSPEIAVQADLDLSIRMYEKQRFSLAYLLARNAASLATISEKSGEQANKARIVSRKSETAKRVRRVPCVACNGSGKRVIQRDGLSPGSSQTFTTRFACKACNGSGQSIGRSKLGNNEKSRAAAIVDYVRLQQKRGYAPEGKVWVPEAWVGVLSLDEVASLRRALPPACKKCSGAGKLACRGCDGKGHDDCPARGCDGGKVKKSTEGLSGGNTSRVEKCKECGGNGQVSCGDCGGRGLAVCEECHETGLPPVCDKCEGVGIGACRSCRGTGSRRDEDCRSCKGSGRMLCSGCDGYGHDD